MILPARKVNSTYHESLPPGQIVGMLAALQADCKLFTLFTLLAYLNYTLQTPNRSPEPSDFS